MLRHRRHQGDDQGHGLQAQGDQGAGALRRRATCCSAATRSPVRWRRPPGPARASASTRPCTATRPGSSMRFPALVLARRPRRPRRCRDRVLARLRPAARPRGLCRRARRPTGRADHRAGRERVADRGDRGQSRDSRPGPSRSRSPRRTRRARSATSTAGTATRSACSSSGPRRAGARWSRSGPVLRHQRVLRRAGEDRRLPADADHRGGPAGPALRVPGGLRGPRHRRAHPRLRAHRLQPRRAVQLRGRRAHRTGRR